MSGAHSHPHTNTHPMTRARPLPTKMSPDLEAALPPMNQTGKGSVLVPMDSLPEANYTKISERLRKSTPPDIQCAMFCGGKKCKYECANWPEYDMVIPGVFSHWVTDNIVAMARPNTENIKKYKIIEFFKEHGIRSIINLQEPGEHANCGNALTISGFSYDPTQFMDNDVFFYNFHWKDYSIVSVNALLDMAKVMTFALTEGKVAIHCHAGLGRTGVLIAAYLVYTFRCKPQDAIRYVRSKRPNAIQTRGQIESVLKFAQFILPLFVIYPHIIPKHFPLTLSDMLTRQRLLLHGYELRHLRNIPKIIYVICERLLQLCGQSNHYSRGIARRTFSSNDQDDLDDRNDHSDQNDHTSHVSHVSHATETNINFQLSNNESFTKNFFSSLKQESEMIEIGKELSNGSRPYSQLTLQFSSGVCSPDSSSTRMTVVNVRSRDRSANSKRSNSNCSSENGVTHTTHTSTSSSSASSNNHWSSLPPVDESSDDNHHYYFTPMQQLGMIGLDTPKKSRSNGSVTSTSSENDGHYNASEDSLEDSLTSLLDNTGSYMRVLQVDTLVHENHENHGNHDHHEQNGYHNYHHHYHHHNGKQESYHLKNSRLFDQFEHILASDSSEEDETELESTSSGGPGSSGYDGFMSAGEMPSNQDDEDVFRVDPSKIIKLLSFNYKLFGPDFIFTLLKYQKELNITGWDRLSHETSVELLIALMYSWTDHLKEPILDKHALCHIVLKAEKPVKALLSLEENIRYTIEYLLRFVARLNPDEEAIEIIILYLMAILTKQCFKTPNGKTVPSGRDWPEMRRGTGGRVLLFANGVYQLLRTKRMNE